MSAPTSRESSARRRLRVVPVKAESAKQQREQSRSRAELACVCQRGAQRLISLCLTCATWRRRLQLLDERAAWPKWGSTP